MMALLFRQMSIRRPSRLVAIVDDDASVQRSLQDLIESDGLFTLCFGSGEQFLDSEARTLAMRENAVEFLSKPFDDKFLPETVNAALDR
jgi:FixJ family two-component response regulator